MRNWLPYPVEAFCSEGVPRELKTLHVRAIRKVEAKPITAPPFFIYGGAIHKRDNS